MKPCFYQLSSDHGIVDQDSCEANEDDIVIGLDIVGDEVVQQEVSV